ncbi:hypothetical protein [Caballeronia sp. LZ019]|uniref:hypothetical protein n=1 Tax=Caballeronia sp. LZ019 TaxID=3038555 RepID=UPI0028580A8D|nr:hypothetical protein [Caballeronia sp. LZ019]MDR5811195.1 hypothetical protein [Caballeronia sp. LZ019]
MNLKTRAIVAAGFVAFATAGFSAESEPSFVQQGKEAIQACESEYQGYLAIRQVSRLADDARRDADDAMTRAGGPVGTNKASSEGDVQLYHKQCVAEKKRILLPEAKRFINGFKRPVMQSKAKKLVAQWMTTMDAIGSSVADQEAAKFDTLANELQLETM